MRNLRRAQLAVGLGLVGLFVTACGGGAGLLSSNQANTLNDQLNRVSSAYSAGKCNDVRSAVRGLAGAVAGLPATVKPALREDLNYTANQVVSLAVSQCRVPAPPTATTTETTSTATTTAPPTTTTQTQQTHSTTTPTPTTPATTPTTPGSNSGPSGGGGLPGGSGGAGGGSSGGAGTGGTGNGNGSNG